ncbi:MAG: LicD family protein [Ruminococcus flavefaciens]
MKLETTSIFKNLKSKSASLIELDDEMLSRLKECILEIAHDVIEVCEENNVSYHLTGGSALGAVRHHGFIPWDDDMDLDMERKDVKRFLAAFSKKYGDKYWIHNDSSSEKFCIPFIQIRKKGTINRGILDAFREECGVYIDIAIIENTYNNPIRRKIHGIGSLFLGFAVSCRRFCRDRKYLLNLSDDPEVIKIFKTKIFFGRLFSFLSLRKWTQLYSKWNSKCKDTSTKYVTVPTGRNHFFREMYERKDFCESTTMEFEGNTWKIPKAYDKYLTHMYGDYMKIPKGSDREKHVLLEFKL